MVKLLFVLPFMLWHFNSLGQHTVTGQVTDASNDESLPGVNILIAGTSQGTSTDVNGTYEITAPSASDTLIFSFIGFETQTVPINGRSEINIQLVPQTYRGGELVVVGYGTQRREDITSAVATVSSDAFLQNAPRDALELIKGKVAGLVISSPSGDPRGGVNIILRGTTTLEAPSSPLVLIDGVPCSGGDDDPGDIELGLSDCLRTVSPENIESISVLKDGSAAAIYGSRGSNGVILITTKKHSGLQPATINYQGYLNVQQIVNRPDFMTGEEYRRAIQEQDFPAADFGADTDWQDQILRNPASQNHTLTLSGGNLNTNYSASINYRGAEGIIITSNDDELRGRINVRHSMFDDGLVANMSLNYRTEISSSFNNNAWYQALIRNPTDQIKDGGGNWQERPGFNYYNPLAMLHEAIGEMENRDLRINGTLAWKPVENLSLQVLGSSSRFTSLEGYAETYQHLSTTFNNLNGFASRSTFASTDDLFEFTGTWQNSIEAHSFNLLGGYSWQEVVQENFSANNRDFPTDLFTYNSIESGVGLQDGLAGIFSGKESYKLIGFFGRLNYDYDNRYILMGSVRYEGNSKFGADNKWGLFPAVSVGWRISNESFMENIGFINDLKIRAGFGVTGIAPGNPYQSLASFEFSAFFYNGGEWIRGVEPSRNPNPDLRWERKEEINLGLDFTVMDDLSGSVDLYRRNTKDLLFEYDVPSPPFLFDEILANVGEMKNEGLEIALQYTAVQTQDFTWMSGINYSTNRNKLVTLSNELYQTENNFLNAGGLGESVQLPTHRIFVGGEVGNFYGYKVIDVAQGCDYTNSQGDCVPDGRWIIEGIIYDEDGNRIGTEAVPYFDLDLDDRQVIGNGVPDHNLSWNNTFRYKNFDLSIFVRGAFGFQILNETRLFYENPTQNGLNLLDSAFHKVFGKAVLDNEWQYMDYYIEDGDYVKIDNVTLGYAFDVARWGDFISNARVYVSAQNLYTFTGYSGLDPEVNIAGLNPGHDFRNSYRNSIR